MPEITVTVRTLADNGVVRGSTIAGSPPEVEVPANHRRGLETVGGRLTITCDRLVFKPHAFNIQKRVLEVPILKIVSVSKSSTLGLIPNGMTVTTDDGQKHQFVVWDRDRLIDLIKSFMPFRGAGA